MAVNTTANRLYVYALDTVTGGNVVLLAVDTATNQPVEPSDPDGDGRPGLTLFRTPPPSAAGLDSLPPWSILAVTSAISWPWTKGGAASTRSFPGVVEVDAAGKPVNIAPGSLIVIDGRNDVLAVVSASTWVRSPPASPSTLRRTAST